MCLRCAGWSDDEIARHHARLVDAHGWAAIEHGEVAVRHPEPSA